MKKIFLNRFLTATFAFTAFMAVSGCNKSSFKANSDGATRTTTGGTATTGDTATTGGFSTGGTGTGGTDNGMPASSGAGVPTTTGDSTPQASATSPVVTPVSTPVARPPVLARNVTGFVFSGDGPGSCGGANGCVPSAQPCPVGFTATPGLQGDCFECSKFPGKCPNWTYKHLCNGNRLICRQSGTATTGLATVDLHFFYDQCAAGFEPAGPPTNRFHVLSTNILDRGNTSMKLLHLCKRTKPVEQLQTGDLIVTDLQFFTPGSRRADIAACPANDPAGSFSWAQAGVFPDCVRANVPTTANSGICTGLLTACKKYERVP